MTKSKEEKLMLRKMVKSRLKKMVKSRLEKIVKKLPKKTSVHKLVPMK